MWKRPQFLAFFWGAPPLSCEKYRKIRLLVDSLKGRIPLAAAFKAVAKTAAAKAKVETVSTRQLASQLAEKHELSQKSANAMLEDTIALITKHLKKGARIRLNGLGILVVRKRGPRMGRNPATGEAIKIKASKKVAFRVARDLRAAITGLPGDESTEPPLPVPPRKKRSA